LEVRPLQGRVESFQVYFPVARPAPPEWLLDDDRHALEAHRVGGESPVEGSGTAGGETWTVRPLRPRPGTLVVHVRRRASPEPRQPANLPFLPQAARQETTVEVRAAERVPLVVDAPNWVTAPAGASTGGMPPLRAVRRLRSEDSPRLSAGPVLWVVTPNDAALPRLPLVRRQRVDSHYAPDGASWHRVLVELESAGEEELEFQGAPSASLWEASVDGRPVRLVERGAWQVVPLRGAAGPTVVEIRFQQAHPPLASLAALSAPSFLVRATVQREEWIVWLRPDFEMAPGEWGGAPSWSERCAGRSRWSAAGLFLPWRREAWWSLVGSSRATSTAQSAAELWLKRLNEALPAAALDATWGQVFERASAGRDVPPLACDAQALAATNVWPTTPLPKSILNVRPARAETLLAEAGLVLVAGPDGCWLTSQQFGDQRERGALAPDDRPVVLLVEAAWEALREANRAQSGRETSLSMWLTTASPRAATELLVENPTRWQAWPVGAGVRQATIVRRPLWRAASWCVGGLVFGLASWALGGRRALLMGVLLAWLVVWLPDPWYRLAAGAAWGLIAARLAARLTARAGKSLLAPAAAPHTNNRATEPARVAGLLVLAIAILQVAHPCHAQPAVDAPELFEVLVPTDADRRPAGEQVFVPQAFLDRLRLRAAQHVEARHTPISTVDLEEPRNGAGALGRRDRGQRRGAN
jgi:hypothetical protein